MAAAGVNVNLTNAGEVAKTMKEGAVVGPATVRRSPSIAALATAMLQAQQEMKNPAKKSLNPHFKSHYADLAEVRDCVLPAMQKHGLLVIQLPCDMDGAPALQTLLIHPESAEWIETTTGLRPTKMDPQGVGSALTYARRYALQSIAGVAAEDDDGEAASRTVQQTPAAKPASVADNQHLRKKITDAIGLVKDRGTLSAEWKLYEADRAAGNLSAADCAHLEPLFQAASKKFPKVQPAAAR